MLAFMLSVRPCLGPQVRRFCVKPPGHASPVSPTFFSKAKHLVQWLKQTAREKGKPFIAWYATLYVGGLLGAYAGVRVYDGVEPEVVKSWAYKLHADKLIDLE